MKNLKIYQITKEQFEDTEYRPLGVEIDDTIETEDEWNYGDVVDNAADGYIAEKVIETSDGLIVWKVTNHWDDDDYESYVVEIAE